MQLVRRRVELVRQVVRAALLQRRIDELPGHGLGARLRVRGQPDVAHLDDRECGTARGVGEGRRGIGGHVAHRRAEHVHLAGDEDLAEAVHERDELLDRHVVLLDDVRVAARVVLEELERREWRPHRVVAGDDPGLAGAQLDLLLEPPAERLRPVEAARQAEEEPVAPDVRLLGEVEVAPPAPPAGAGAPPGHDHHLPQERGGVRVDGRAREHQHHV